MLSAALSTAGPTANLKPGLGAVRLGLVGLVAFSASLPMAWISVSKLVLFVAGLAALLARIRTQTMAHPVIPDRTTALLLGTLALFTVSLSWTVADFDTGLLALVKHAKLLEIILLVILIRNRQEARLALWAFVGGQVLLLLASWMLVAGMPLPYATKSPERGVVFSSYLDQGIMLAVCAGIVWHLRPVLKLPTWLALTVVAAALANVLLVLQGRTGYVVAFATLAMAIIWLIPGKFRLGALAGVPLVLALGLFFSSSLTQTRIATIASEVKAYSQKPETVSSSGWRLNSWTHSVSAIVEQPWHGHGVGGWTATVKRLQGPSAAEVFGSSPASNPHQEYLLWGVELGVGGIILLVLLLASMAHDFRKFPIPVYRAGLSVVVALAVACLFNSTVYDGLIGDYFCVLLGLLMALGLHQEEEAQHA